MGGGTTGLVEGRTGLATDGGGAGQVRNEAEQAENWAEQVIGWAGAKDGECGWAGDGAAELGKLPGSSEVIETWGDVGLSAMVRTELEARVWLVFCDARTGVARELGGLAFAMNLPVLSRSS